MYKCSHFYNYPYSPDNKIEEVNYYSNLESALKEVSFHIDLDRKVTIEKIDFEPVNHWLLEAKLFNGPSDIKSIKEFHNFSELKNAFKNDPRNKLWEFGLDIIPKYSEDINYPVIRYDYSTFPVLLDPNNWPIIIFQLHADIDYQLTNNIKFDPTIWK